MLVCVGVAQHCRSSERLPPTHCWLKPVCPFQTNWKRGPSVPGSVGQLSSVGISTGSVPGESQMRLAAGPPAPACPLHTSTERFWAIGMLLLPTVLLLVVWSPFCTLCDLSSSESNKVCRTEKAACAALWDVWCESLACATASWGFCCFSSCGLPGGW